MEPQSLLSIKAKLQQQRLPVYRNIIRWTWMLLGFGLAAGILIVIIISLSAIPSFRELEDPKSAVASEVLAYDGTLLGRYFIENRVPVRFEDLNPDIVNALVSTEDVRYWSHCGVDARAVARVVVRTILLRDQSAGGGSTITQQLAKMLYSDRNFSGMNKVEKLFALVYRKLREWITAVKLEKSYTKEEILAMYLNQVDYVNNAYGIQSAAEVYFGEGQDKLSTEEAATIVGMLQNPSYFNPARFPDRCMRRRMIVLSQMQRNEYLTKSQYDSLKVLPLDMSRFKKVSFSDDKAPYLCAELKKDLSDILDQPECRKPDGSKYNIYKEGLKIYTTIDPTYQKYAEAAMEAHMKKIQNRFFTVWKGKNPWKYKTGETTDEEIQQRGAMLNRLVREGDRYQALRPKYLDEVASEVEDRFGFELRDIDILRMLEEDKKPGAMARMIKQGWVSNSQSADYHRVMSDAIWSQIKRQWRSLAGSGVEAIQYQNPNAGFFLECTQP
ncbi:MAG: transglycosylase domain-containing protein [Saprospiraceae bacterium]